jgi:two-component sensor histidine kinase
MAVATTAMAAMVLLMTLLGWADRRDDLRGAQRDAVRFARALADDLSHVAATADLLLGEAETVAAATDWTRSEAVDAAWERLKSLNQHLPFVVQTAILGPDGEVLVNTQQNRPGSSRGIERPDLSIQRGEEAVSVAPGGRGRPGGLRTVVFSRRFEVDAQRRGTVTLGVDVDHFVATFRSQLPGAAATLEVLREDLGVVLRDPPLPGPAAALPRADPSFAAMARQGPSGGGRYVDAVDGVARIHGYQLVPNRGLIVNVGLAEDEVLSDWWLRLGLGAGLVLLMLSGLAIIVLLANRRLQGEALHREELRSAKSDLEDLVQQRTTALEATVRELETVAEDRQLLFSELNHRIRNNLQLIGSLFSLQAARIRDPQARAVFEEGIERVHSISLVHDLLYQSPRADAVDIGQLLRILCDRLVTVFVPDGRVVCSVSAMSADVGFDTAIRLGLIVNEVVSNALKHSFPDDRRGHVTVTFKEGEQLYRLTVVDDGVGSSMTTASGEARLGVQLVDLLGRNLDAMIHRERIEGVHKFELSLPR